MAGMQKRHHIGRRYRRSVETSWRSRYEAIAIYFKKGAPFVAAFSFPLSVFFGTNRKKSECWRRNFTSSCLKHFGTLEKSHYSRADHAELSRRASVQSWRGVQMRIWPRCQPKSYEKGRSFERVPPRRHRDRAKNTVFSRISPLTPGGIPDDAFCQFWFRKGP